VTDAAALSREPVLVTDDQLRQLLEPAAGAAEKAALYGPALRAAFRAYDITTPLRQAHFLGQALHETGRLRWLTEIWGPTEQQKKYEPPSTLATTLGNTEPGDGFRFRGGGLFHLTGRANHEKYLEYLRSSRPSLRGLQLEELLDGLRSSPLYQCDSAGWYWHTRGLNALADADDVPAVTKRINGGYTHLEERRALVARAKAVLGA
jgi:putative chitinase